MTTITADQDPAQGLVHYQDALDQLLQGLTPPATLIGSAASCLTSVLMRDAVVVMMTGVTLPDPDQLNRDGLPQSLVADAMSTILDPDKGCLPDATVTLHADLLTRIVAHLTPAECAPAHTLLALIAWWSGDVATASRHLKNALAADPTYRLAHLLECTCAAGMQPGWATTKY
jgi:hypothetical protein